MNTVPHEYRGTAGRARLLEVLSSQKLVQRDPTIAKDLLAVAKPMTFLPRRDKDHLIVEGERKFDIYFILSGSVSVRIKRQEVAIRGPGDHVGEMALIDSKHPRSASVIATERTTVAKVSQQAFLKVAAKHPELWQRLCVELGSRLRQRGSSIPKPNSVPTVFIGSASGQQRIMNALANAIKGRYIKVRRWSKGVFGLSETTIESLESAIGNADFAIIILAADDKIIKDGKIVETPRDNCVFELGMGVGGLGRSRTLFLKENKKLHLLSDLNGVTYFPYDAKPRAKFQRQIKAAARQIKARVNALKTK